MYTPSKDYRTRRFDIVHVLDVFAKHGRTHADSLIEVSDSLARLSFGVIVKEVSIPRLKLELDPGHPERMRHDFNLGMEMVRSAVRSQHFIICLGASSQRDCEMIKPYSALTTGHDRYSLVFIDVSRSAAVQ